MTWTLFLLFVVCLQQLDKPTGPAENGLYLTASDFEGGQLVYPFRANRKGCHWRPGRHGRRSMMLVLPDTIIQADESTYWGFRRAGRNLTYEVIDHDRLVLYSVESFGMEGRRIFYYFSASSDAPVMRLSRKQLHLTFGHHIHFLRLLDSMPPSVKLTDYMVREGHTSLVEFFRRSQIIHRPNK
ncbi:hypothetical protein [Nibrella saemangeumensis]|uniref:hypothetical protein n=1 Tax=Nibrella saemangeumensis TaxID=1084526 RepID=UPI0031E5C46C